jgi:hypothetical protein
MKTLKLIWLIIIQWVRQIYQLSKTIAEQQRRTVQNELEAERRDRTCNPSKYLGK